MDRAKHNTDTIDLSRRDSVVGRRPFCVEAYSRECVEHEGMQILVEVRSNSSEIRGASKEHGFLGDNN